MPNAAAFYAAKKVIDKTSPIISSKVKSPLLRRVFNFAIYGFVTPILASILHTIRTLLGFGGKASKA